MTQMYRSNLISFLKKKISDWEKNEDIAAHNGAFNYSSECQGHIKELKEILEKVKKL